MAVMLKRIVSIVVILLVVISAVLAVLPIGRLAAAPITFTTSSSDGRNTELTTVSWATAWGASSAGYGADSSSLYVGDHEIGIYYQIDRGYLFFDTSTIPIGSTVLTAKISLYCLDTATWGTANVIVTDGAFTPEVANSILTSAVTTNAPPGALIFTPSNQVLYAQLANVELDSRPGDAVNIILNGYLFANGVSSASNSICSSPATTSNCMAVGTYSARGCDNTISICRQGYLTIFVIVL